MSAVARAVALAAGAALLAAAPASDRIKALRWTDPAQALPALTTLPPECLRLPDDPAQRASAEIGRAAFRTPLLLGGQAARLGLSCASCHANGRTNPAFRFPGLSGAPGTADVTNALMSTHRDNGVFDPRPIPDLALPGKVARTPGTPDLRQFIHGLIVSEFDGQEPPPAVLDGLVAYVRSLDAHACSTPAPSSLTQAWADTAQRAVRAAQERLASGDRPTAHLMLAAARSALGLLDERYAALPRDHAVLLQEDRALAAIQTSAATGAGTAGTQLDRWIAASREWTARLRQDEPRSLFASNNLRRHLNPS